MSRDQTPLRIDTPDAPAAIGPYSQAVRAGSFLFVSGQIPLDPATGSLVPGGIGPQTDRVLRNLSAILAAEDASLSAVVKTTVYLADMDEFSAMNDIYAQHFSGVLPARATVQAMRLPRDARVEIDAIAFVPDRLPG